MLKTMKRDVSRTCPYARRGAKCRSGCWSEPFCVTQEPLRGWPWARLMNRARTYSRCTGVLSWLDGQADCGRTDFKHAPHPFRSDTL